MSPNRSSRQLSVVVIAAAALLVVVVVELETQTTTTMTSRATRGEEEEKTVDERRWNETAGDGLRSTIGGVDGRLFVLDLLRTLQEEHGGLDGELSGGGGGDDDDDDDSARRWGGGLAQTSETEKPNSQSARGNLEDRRSAGRGRGGDNQSHLAQLVADAWGERDATGSRLVEWVRQTNLAGLQSAANSATQLVISSLGSVNCAGLLSPDGDTAKLAPNFLFFNERTYVDSPLVLPARLRSQAECARLDPARKTIMLIHGYLTGYSLVDGLVNIKDRILDLNALAAAADEQFNVVIVDWVRAANPTPRSNYIRAAVNTQVVGRLVGEFLGSLVDVCGMDALRMQILAHSLGCHVAGFAGKTTRSAGHTLGKIVHLDPTGLCFGRLFARPNLRLASDDAQVTHAVHVSRNLFDNPLDAAQVNFMVNGGRDQIGCGGETKEIFNFTVSQLGLLFDPTAKFAPSIHLRALALFEDDLSSQPSQCQIVGVRCRDYDEFLAGRCANCMGDADCELMSFPPLTRLAQSSQQKQQQHQHHQQQQQQQLSLGNDINSSRHSKDLDLADRRRIAANKSSSSSSSSSSSPARNYLANRIVGGWRDWMSSVLTGLPVSRASTDPSVGSATTAAPTSSSSSSTSTSTSTTMLTTTTTTAAAARTTTSTAQESSPSWPKSQDGSLFFVGTSGLSPHCLTYFQVRALIAETQVSALANWSSTHSRHERQTVFQTFSPQASQPAVVDRPPRREQVRQNAHEIDLKIKLITASGRFFKGFTLVEDTRKLSRVRVDGLDKFELTFLVNSTSPAPERISAAVISYYAHPIVLVDTLELNYMSNISPE